MAAGLRGRLIVDPYTCWKKWHVELGTLRKVREYYRKEGIVNPRTGEPPTKRAIEMSAFNWALNNPEEARKDLDKAWQREGFVLTDDEWGLTLYKFAKACYYQRPGKFRRYVESHNLEKWM